MEILWLGQSCFLIRGKSAKVLTDPYDAKFVGLKLPKMEAEIVTVSHDHPDHNYVSSVVSLESGKPFVVKGPGEYEVKGISVFGVSTYHDENKGADRGKNTVYVIEVDGVKVCHLGDLGHKLMEEQLREIGDVDVLLVPVGGFFTIDAKVAGEVVQQLEPMVVIPMHYKVAGLAPAISGKIAGAEPFLKEMGVDSAVPVQKFVLFKDRLPEQLQTVVLERKS